jgi:signal transduction histidine kinase
MIIFNDITDSLQAEHIRNSFLHLVSHEFRTPLSIIENSSSILALNKGKSDDCEQLVYNIDYACQRLTRFIENITRFSRVLSSTAQLNPVEININRFIKNLIDEY